MGGQSVINQSDICLLPFLSASSEAESEERLINLITEQTETTIKKVIKSKLRVSLNQNDDSYRNQDALEIVVDVQALLIARLRNLKTQNGRDIINNFKSYVASVAYNACHQYLQQKYPLRHQLKYKLRYLLTHQQNFSLWQNEEGDWVCGLKKWRFQTIQTAASQIQNIETLKASVSASRQNANERAFYTELLNAIFDRVKTPVFLDELVSLVIELSGIKEQLEIAETDQGRENLFEQTADSKQNLAGEIEQRERLQKLWEEICRLPIRHRAALLLNLKDKGGECVITYLPLLRIATIRQIAEALDFTPENFAEVWNDLPWDDYDGDGKTDQAVYRNGTWYLNRSQLGFTGVAFGAATDVPVPADYDGDGKADLAVFRASEGAWYLLRSTTGFTGIVFGQSGDKPVPADYDADGKTDVAVFRNGIWYILGSQVGFYGINFGQTGDVPVAADYDGDNKADPAVFRQGIWYLLRSQAGFTGIQFGAVTDVPAPADYDGDSKADLAVFRNGEWYLLRTTSGFTGLQFGTTNDKAVPSAFIP
jgi:hypothetical protein